MICYSVQQQEEKISWQISALRTRCVSFVPTTSVTTPEIPFKCMTTQWQNKQQEQQCFNRRNQIMCMNQTGKLQLSALTHCRNHHSLWLFIGEIPFFLSKIQLIFAVSAYISMEINNDKNYSICWCNFTVTWVWASGTNTSRKMCAQFRKRWLLHIDHNMHLHTNMRHSYKLKIRSISQTIDCVCMQHWNESILRMSNTVCEQKTQAVTVATAVAFTITGADGRAQSFKSYVQAYERSKRKKAIKLCYWLASLSEHDQYTIVKWWHDMYYVHNTCKMYDDLVLCVLKWQQQ